MERQGGHTGTLVPGWLHGKNTYNPRQAGLLSSDGSEITRHLAQKLKNRSPPSRPQVSSWLWLHGPECVVGLSADDRGENKKPTNTYDRNPNQPADRLEA